MNKIDKFIDKAAEYLVSVLVFPFVFINKLVDKISQII